MRKLNNEPADIKYVALGPRQTYLITGQFYYGVFDTMKYLPSIFYICIFFHLSDRVSIFVLLILSLSQYKLDQASASVADISKCVSKLITACFSCQCSSKLVNAVQTVEVP